jgi:uncharacterized protein
MADDPAAHEVHRALIWSIDEIAGFDSAWAWIDGDRMGAQGRSCGLLPTPYWLSYALETTESFVTRHMAVEAQWQEGSATLDLRCDDGAWTVNGDARPDLASALDCDLAACPLTNTMPVLRHRLHREPGAHAFVMAFIEVPTLRVIASQQRYTHVRRGLDGGGIVRYASGSFQSDLTIDDDGFVVDYPQLGRRVEPRSSTAGIRAAGPGSARPG